MIFWKRGPKPAPEPSADQLLIWRLKAWRPIGGSFSYLGRECVVTGYMRWVFYPQIGTRTFAQLQADYADNHGVIHQIRFGHDESEAVMAANP